MKWLRLLLSVVVFPLSLIWYKRDIQHYGISPVVYWLAVGGWTVVNIVITIYAWNSIDPLISGILNPDFG